MEPATARAVEATAKTTGKALDIVHDIGAYLNRVVGDLPDNVVGVLGADWLREKRRRNLDALSRRTQEIFNERDVKELIQLSPNLATELFIAAQDESREELIELWARILANAMDPNMNNVRHSFIDAVRKMDPMDAIVLRYIYETNITNIRFGRTDTQNKTVGVVNIGASINRRDDEVEVSLRHLKDLMFFDEVVHNPGWYVNATTREFLRACYPEMQATAP